MNKRGLLGVCAWLLLAPSLAWSAGGIKVSRSATIDAAPQTVWKLVGGFDTLDVWHPAVVKSVVQGTDAGKGAVRTLTLGDGGVLTEPLVSHNAARMSYTYRITKSPLPIKNYTATISLAPAGDGKTTMTWSADFDANGKPDKEVAELMTGVYDAGLAKVVSIFKR
jgi:mxaD protein